MVVITRPVDEKFEDELQSLDDEFQELKAKLSEVRKKGKDTGIAEVLTYDFAPKLRMAKVTYHKDDVRELKNILKDVRAELKEAEEGTDFTHVLELVKDAYEYLRQDKIKEAVGAYSALVAKYKVLSPELKRPIYRAALDINKKLNKKKRAG